MLMISLQKMLSFGLECWRILSEAIKRDKGSRFEGFLWGNDFRGVRNFGVWLFILEK